MSRSGGVADGFTGADDRSPVRAAHAAHGVVAGLRAPHRTVRTYGHDEYAEPRP
ncbi:hypothetical protein [Streptomyces asiaticus]|uniref:hypothetical protein n=1 Tax=Streptomyces asiaticus TaxID=114695 RepID=UPI0037FB2F17